MYERLVIACSSGGSPTMRILNWVPEKLELDSCWSFMLTALKKKKDSRIQGSIQLFMLEGIQVRLNFWLLDKNWWSDRYRVQIEMNSSATGCDQTSKRTPTPNNRIGRSFSDDHSNPSCRWRWWQLLWCECFCRSKINMRAVTQNYGITRYFSRSIGIEVSYPLAKHYQKKTYLHCKVTNLNRHGTAWM